MIATGTLTQIFLLLSGTGKQMTVCMDLPFLSAKTRSRVLELVNESGPNSAQEDQVFANRSRIGTLFRKRLTFPEQRKTNNVLCMERISRKMQRVPGREALVYLRCVAIRRIQTRFSKHEWLELRSATRPRMSRL
jgi:hypothetical protein